MHAQQQAFGHQHYYQPPPPRSDKWFYTSVLLVIGFVLFQGWTTYQESVQFEKKIQRLQKQKQRAQKKKEEQARREAEAAELINKQIRQQDDFEKIMGLSQYDPDEDEMERMSCNPPQAARAALGADLSRTPVDLKRTRSMAVNDTFGRKTSLLDDPMVASANQRQNNKQGRIPITRICLTGGPCAGKTTALATLSLHLKQLGYRVLLVPEAATILMQGGAMI